MNSSYNHMRNDHGGKSQALMRSNNFLFLLQFLGQVVV